MGFACVLESFRRTARLMNAADPAPALRNASGPRPPDRPRVLVPACNRQLGAHPFHICGQKYIDAVRLAGALPLVMPAALPEELDSLLDVADGLLLTGSPSNVHPRHFDEAVLNPGLPLDPRRDAMTLPLIRLARAHGLPFLAICRGFQEVNVALGGALHQAVQELPGHLDHREDKDAPVAQQYGPAHALQIEPGGLLAGLLGTDPIQVNSLHGQGVKRLAPGLRVEARAPDGLVEAFSVPPTADEPAGAGRFQLGVQWHPEWQAAGNPVSMRLLQAFGQACRAYRAHKQGALGLLHPAA